MRKQKPLHWRKTWTEKQQSNWHDRIEFLEEALPFSKSLRIHRIPMLLDFGDCDEFPFHFIIRISNTLEYRSAVDTLLHELAHALEPNDWIHGAAFFDAYRRLWKADESYEEDFEYVGEL